MTAHWGIADPAAVKGSHQEQERAFYITFHELDARIKIFSSLRLEKLDRLSLQRQLDEIGKGRREAVLELNPLPLVARRIAHLFMWRRDSGRAHTTTDRSTIQRAVVSTRYAESAMRSVVA